MKGFHTDIEKDTVENEHFRKVLFTGPQIQLVLMALKPGEDIGVETHPELDQFIRIDAGSGTAMIGSESHPLKDGSAIVIPAGAKHNVTAGPKGLKLYAVYSKQEHPEKTVQKEKPMKKAKYTRREGTPGNYKYYYDGNGKKRSVPYKGGTVTPTIGPGGTTYYEVNHPTMYEPHLVRDADTARRLLDSLAGKQSEHTKKMEQTFDFPLHRENDNKEKKVKKSLQKGKAGTRGVPDGSGPEGKGPTGRQQPPQKPKRENFESDEEFYRALTKWRYSQKSANKSRRLEGKSMKKSSIALVIIPGQLTKAAKLSGMGAKHPAGLSSVSGNTKSSWPSVASHAERIKLTQMAAKRMMSPKPESAKEHQPSTVDHKGRVPGGKAPHSNYGTNVSGMGSQAHDLFGRSAMIVKPSQIGSSTPKSASEYAGVKKISKPKG